ncbi:MAG: 3-deoxy-D-manno-octulosonic acid transferase [Opitutales bacterium]
MIWAYRILFPILLVLALPYYLWRMVRRGGYGTDFAQRLGFFPELAPKAGGRRRFWVQAVSVGEIQAIGPLLKRLKAAGDVEIVLTTTTSTGYRLARQLHGGSADIIGIFPVDLWPCSVLAWNRIRPDVIVLAEGEIWPEHLAQARSRGVPAALVNGRLSDRSFARHLRLRRLSRTLLGGFSLICAGSEEDARRFREIGVEPVTTGNLKFDVAEPAHDDGSARNSLRGSLGFAGCDCIVLGSSTWPGEETLLLRTVARLRASGADVRLLLTPRHAERREEVARTVAEAGMPWHQRSTGSPAPQGTVVHLADTTGELRRLTAAADVAFCGKSLPPNEGGQTPVEAAAAGVALVYGPRMTNFREMCRELEASAAAFRAEKEEEVAALLSRLVRDGQSRRSAGTIAAAWCARNRGATERTAEILLKATAQAS